jgi:hypothetical protein
MSNDKSRHLFQICASRVKKGEEMGGVYLNTCKHRDEGVATEDVWEFDVTPMMCDIDDPESLFGVADCVLWGARADYLLATTPQDDSGIIVFNMAALYDIWSIAYNRPEEPTEYDMGVEFVDWTDWQKVLDFASAASRT